jgi:hypothetical protein
MHHWGSGGRYLIALALAASAAQAQWANNPKDSSADVLRPDNQDKERQQVDLLLMHLDDRLQKVGFALDLGPAFGSLATGTHHDLTADLSANQTYVVRAVCDMHCGDVDLTVFNDQGQIVGQDLATDTYPLVTIKPLRAQTYTIRVLMRTCHTTECRWGLAVFK